MEKFQKQKVFYFRFYILCENFSKIGPIIKKIPKFSDDPLKLDSSACNVKQVRVVLYNTALHTALYNTALRTVLYTTALRILWKIRLLLSFCVSSLFYAGKNSEKQLKKRRKKKKHEKTVDDNIRERVNIIKKITFIKIHCKYLESSFQVTYALFESFS